MKPAFAIVDWDMFVVPVLVYLGPDEVPSFIKSDIERKVAASRHAPFLSAKGIVRQIGDLACDIHEVHAQTICEGDIPFIRMWTYSDAILAHEIVHVIQHICETRGICDREFFAYAMEWLFADLRKALTGKWQKPIYMRGSR